MKALLKPSLNWLLVFVPVTIVMRFVAHDRATLIFIFACISIIPLAGWMGKATEHLAERTSEGIGGLLNATFGNAAELIIAIVALNKGLTDIVKASLTGSIIGNILLVLGLSLLCGGLKNHEQKFNAIGARIQSTMLTLAAIGLIAPAAFHYSVPQGEWFRENPLSLAIAIILLVTYALGLLFSLKTHKKFFAGHGHSTEENVGEPAAAHGHGHGAGGAIWPLNVSIVVLVAATALIAWISEILVGSVEVAAETLGMSQVFVGVIVVAIIGNAAEHSTAILMALKNRMDLSLGIAIGSSIQIALFVAPLLVILSYWIGPAGAGPMDLVFTLPEVIAVALAISITSQISGDGRSNWLEGVLLLSVYAVLAVVFYFMPGEAAHAVGH